MCVAARSQSLHYHQFFTFVGLSEEGHTDKAHFYCVLHKLEYYISPVGDCSESGNTPSTKKDGDASISRRI